MFELKFNKSVNADHEIEDEEQIDILNTVIERVQAIEDDIAELNEKIDNIQITGGGIVEEKDPTVPQHVKNITQEDIENWNNKSSEPDISNFITKDVTELINYYDKDYIDNLVGDIETLLGGI